MQVKGEKIRLLGGDGDGWIRKRGEHLKGCSEQSDENALWKHLEGAHRGENKGNEIFSMKVERGFRKALARQISEGVAIEMSEGELLNSKSEWNNSRIPRIIIEEGERQTEDTESGLGGMSERGKDRGQVDRIIKNKRRNEKKEAEGNSDVSV